MACGHMCHHDPRRVALDRAASVSRRCRISEACLAFHICLACVRWTLSNFHVVSQFFRSKMSRKNSCATQVSFDDRKAERLFCSQLCRRVSHVWTARSFSFVSWETVVSTFPPHRMQLGVRWASIVEDYPCHSAASSICFKAPFAADISRGKSLTHRVCKCFLLCVTSSQQEHKIFSNGEQLALALIVTLISRSKYHFSGQRSGSQQWRKAGNPQWAWTQVYVCFSLANPDCMEPAPCSLAASAQNSVARTCQIRQDWSLRPSHAGLTHHSADLEPVIRLTIMHAQQSNLCFLNKFFFRFARQKVPDILVDGE